jgi:hypothetical protein
MRNPKHTVFLLVLTLLAVGLSGCAWGGVSGLALLAALLLALGAGCHERAIGTEDDAGVGPDTGVDAGTIACDEGACPEFMTCATVQGDFWCLPDVDGDGVPDDEDNCVWLANPDQVDTEGDGWGNACDLWPEEDNMLSPCGPWCAVDEDGDGIAGMVDGDYPFPRGDDNCPLIYNPDQADEDLDGVGDACDLCPDPNPITTCGDACLDSDGDGISDMGDCAGAERDECPGTPSAGSGDYDGDALPDVCDPDGIPPIASRELRRRALLERLRSDGVLEAATVRTALG